MSIAGECDLIQELLGREMSPQDLLRVLAALDRISGEQDVGPLADVLRRLDALERNEADVGKLKEVVADLMRWRRCRPRYSDE